MKWKPTHQTDPNKPRRITIHPDTYALLWRLQSDLKREEKEIVHLALRLLAAAMVTPIKSKLQNPRAAKRARGIESLSRYTKSVIQTVKERK